MEKPGATRPWGDTVACGGAAPEGGHRRVASPEDLHQDLGLPVPAFAGALEPIAVTGMVAPARVTEKQKSQSECGVAAALLTHTARSCHFLCESASGMCARRRPLPRPDRRCPPSQEGGIFRSQHFARRCLCHAVRSARGWEQHRRDGWANRCSDAAGC